MSLGFLNQLPAAVRNFVCCGDRSKRDRLRLSVVFQLANRLQLQSILTGYKICQYVKLVDEKL